jgi:aerobic-type carbon monoxide dehydrogenase small subunit (CoxS/CutS family)
MEALTLTVNGVAHPVEAEPGMPLLWVLRDLLGLTGTKFGCGMGLCGACIVLADGEALRSCTTPVSSSVGRAITTIEGLSPGGDHPVQQAWLAESVSQCGYCQPGQILTAVALLERRPKPDDADIEAAFAGTLCRCGTYRRIRRAVHRAASGG